MDSPNSTPAASPREKPRRPPLLRLLDVAASLRVTVVLFVMSLFLVFWGTWAQVDRGVWEVVNDYFRNDFFVMIPIKVLTCFQLPQEWPINKVSIPYPGGYLLGWCLFTNLLAAHIVRFKATWKRSGIIIMHAGVLLMMLGEYFTGKFAVEGIMTMSVGETVNFIQDNRACELAITDVTDDKRTENDVVTIYAPGLRKKQVTNSDLPFDVEVKSFMPNSDLEPAKPGEDAPATRGRGQGLVARLIPEGSGVDPNQRVDTPSVVVKLKAKNGDDLGTYLFSYFLARPDVVKVGDKKYEVQLRPKRSYRDYTVTLEKAEQKEYPGVALVQSYSSDIVVNDPKNNVRNYQVHIYMNNPLRYNGETFFQASMNKSPDGDMTTGLQVVRNAIYSFPVWWIPYAACVIVAIGMLFHFGVNLVGFLETQARSMS